MEQAKHPGQQFDTEMAKTDQRPIYQGGVAGTCFVADNENRWSTDPVCVHVRVHGKQDTNNKDPTDPVAQNLKDYSMPGYVSEDWQALRRLGLGSGCDHVGARRGTNRGALKI
jgi:hypothetical protein